MRNANKSPKISYSTTENETVIRNPHVYPDQCQHF